MRRGFLLVLAVVALAVIASVSPTGDPDLWWHLRTGQLALTDPAKLALDPFSYTREGQPYACGSEATRALEALIGDQPVRCYGRSQDRYGRPLVTCWAGHSELNVDMVQRGRAVAEFSTMYQIDEALAQRQGVGAWAGTFQRPKDWRKQHPR